MGLKGKKNNSNYDSRPLAGVNSELFIITQRYYLFSKGFELRGAVFRGFMLPLPLRHAGCVLAFFVRPSALPAVAPSALKGTFVNTRPIRSGVTWFLGLREVRGIVRSHVRSYRRVLRPLVRSVGWSLRSLYLPPSLPSAAFSASLRPRSLFRFLSFLALSGCPIELKTLNNVNGNYVAKTPRSLRSLASHRP